jgi:hypothetical protein
MAKSVVDKLLTKPGAAVWSSDPSRLKLVGPMPGGVRSADALGDADAALVFADDAASLRAILGEHGMRPIAQIAVDDVWSALRFRALEEGEPAFTGA